MKKWTENIRGLRTAYGYTQSFVAEKLGCTTASYGKYELGTREPSLEILIALADLYQISVDELIGHQISKISQKMYPEINYGAENSQIFMVDDKYMAYLKKNFDVEYAKSLGIHFMTKRVQTLEGYYDCLTVTDVYREIEYLIPITGCSILDLVRIFGISRSGFYSWKEKGNTVRKRNEHIALKIMQYEVPALDSAGYQAVTEYLHTFDDPELQKISVARVHRIMDEFEIVPEDLRNKKNAVIQEAIGKKYGASRLPIAENKIRRDFDITVAPCKKWCIDITEVKTDEGKLYLCPIMDFCGRYILGYEYSVRMTVGFVKKALNKAYARAKCQYSIDFEPIILHSDRGSQFRSTEFRELEKNLMIDASMSRPFSPNDNACIECFFASLKCEYLNRFRLNSIDAAKKLIDRYIYFYNNIRVHQTFHSIPVDWWLAAVNQTE